jgi:DNA polymerase III sliding clamp (beta) subunit (PCNA family)
MRFPLSFVDDAIRLQVTDQQATFRDAGGFWTSQLLEGEYPDASPYLDATPAGELRFARQTLRDALDRMSVFESVRTVRLVVDEQQRARIAGVDADYGHVEERLDPTGTWSGAITFSLAHLLDAVSAIDDATVRMEMSGHLQPVVIRSAELVQVVLPRAD